ncbi:MAG TPA: protein kinase [Planctomycetaceae bacterium]|nr:protein kinase [Planctomycetaceae bacterium]
MNKQTNLRTIEINADVVRRIMRQKGWSADMLTRRATISLGTLSAVLKGGHNMFFNRADSLRKALGLSSLEELEVPTSCGEGEEPSSVRSIHEWQLDDSLSRWITASNALQFRLWKLKHEHLTKHARGKCYDLQGMSSQERNRCHDQLLRHPKVCAQIGRHPHIIENITTCEASDKASWWVIDYWIDGETLETVLQAGALQMDAILKILKGIAEGLAVLHSHEIIRRELNPKSILICSESGEAILTEFELAKLLDGSPTVSSRDWLTDPYRAQEASAGDINIRADVFSWGQIAIHMLTGQCPATGSEVGLLAKTAASPSLKKLIKQCVSISKRSRPSSMQEVLQLICDEGYSHE